MKIKTMKLIPKVIVFFSFYAISSAQVSAPFKVRYQGIIKGDMAIIANNIVNRVDYNNSSNTPYYNHTNQAKLNDEFNMDYIDIDNDEDTFSSSSAEFFLENPRSKRIVYAGIYWSATYKYNIGTIKNENKFIAEDANRETFTSIKIKFPNHEKYTDIVGQTLFDGLKQSEFKDFAPYAVYADITEYVKKLPTASGVYTVANIKATQGKISGGVAGGWTIFFVYEDDSLSEKYIKSQDGFAGINNNPTDIVFDGFELKQGQVNVRIAGASLEGDNNLIGDQLFVADNQLKVFLPISSTLRKENNFFNSCISIEDEYFSNRFPDSKNTLGYDSFLLTIPNQNNSILGNNCKESILRFKSSGDKIFLFFTAFEVELKPNSYSNNSKDIVNQTKDKKTIKIVPMDNDLLEDENKTASAINRIQKNNTLGNDIIEIHSFNSSTIPSGYYLLASIFKTDQKTQEFIYNLKTKKIVANAFTNPLNNYFYVYLTKVNSQQEAIDLYQSKMNGSYQERLQIVLINNDNLAVKPISEVVNEKSNLVQKQVENIAVSSSTKTMETSIKNAFDDNKLKSIVSNDVHIANIPNEPQGYYIVANVFAYSENEKSFIKFLKNRGLDPNSLLNPITKYKYIYLKKVDTLEQAQELLNSKLNNKYQSKIWILSVNNNQ